MTAPDWMNKPEYKNRPAPRTPHPPLYRRKVRGPFTPGRIVFWLLLFCLIGSLCSNRR
ncbi:hypothetical protein GCM10010169_23470 [Micromonospora fulviviridis]|uniref:hypothetical protein n=1 Tax=Micromonospora fulviviridis TaxID=47860 RepID=UPI00166D2042|nr:hypothetical protein [Micromonospora fulviviridis]GGR78591.1 hypothetical protein GCM10010169_23470 [Micromonospora fulviviridis]